MVKIILLCGLCIFTGYEAYQRGYKSGYDDAINGDAEGERLRHEV